MLYEGFQEVNLYKGARGNGTISIRGTGKIAISKR
jgi:hypothetical protein